MYTAIVSTTRTLVAFLRQRLESDPDLSAFFSGGTLVVTMNNPEEMDDASLEGVSVWLYRVVRDEDRLNAPPERVGSTQRRQTPLPLRLHYLITPLVGAAVPDSPELEQAILGKILQSLYDHPVFRGVDLQGDFSGTDVEFSMRLEP